MGMDNAIECETEDGSTTLYVSLLMIAVNRAS